MPRSAGVDAGAVTGRPVKWIEERSENYVATIHGRGVTHDCTLAGMPEGQNHRPKVRRGRGHGGVLPAAQPRNAELAAGCIWGRTTPEAYWFEFRGVLTNTTPTDAYRGAGRPEATYVLEWILDATRSRSARTRLRSAG